MDSGILAQWGATTVLALGLVVTWARNGRSQTRENEAMKKDLEHIKEKIDDEHSGLGAIKESVDKQENRCASVTADYHARIIALEKKRE